MNYMLLFFTFPMRKINTYEQKQNSKLTLTLISLDHVSLKLAALSAWDPLASHVTLWSYNFQ